MNSLAVNCYLVLGGGFKSAVSTIETLSLLMFGLPVMFKIVSGLKSHTASSTLKKYKSIYHNLTIKLTM